MLFRFMCMNMGGVAKSLSLLIILTLLASGCLGGGFSIQKDELFDNVAITFNSPPVKYYLQEEKSEQMIIKITNLHHTNIIDITCKGGGYLNCINCPYSIPIVGGGGAGFPLGEKIPPGDTINYFTFNVQPNEFTIPGKYETSITCFATELGPFREGYGSSILRQQRKDFPIEVWVLR